MAKTYAVATVTKSAGVTAQLTGTAVTSNAGTLGVVKDLPLVGTAVTSSAGNVGAAQSLVGTEVTSYAGVGTPEHTIPLVGTQVVASAGLSVAEVTVPLVGTEVLSNAGTLVPDSSITVPLEGTAVTTSAGVLVNEVTIPLVGTAVTSYAGALVSDTSIALTGTSVSSETGTLTAEVGSADVSVPLTGEALSCLAGTLVPQLEVATVGTAVAASAGIPVASVVLSLTGTAVSTSSSGDWPGQSSVTYLPIVPNGRGPGMETPAGSGREPGVSAATWISRQGTTTGVTTTRIRYVDNLADTDTYNGTTHKGTLRGCINAHNNDTGPSTIVFETSGSINNTTDGNDIRVLRGQLSIYGQTAPSPGVELTGCGLTIFDNDVVVQHLALRRGDRDYPYDPDYIQDSLSIARHNAPSTALRRVVIDHCCIQWGADECAEAVYNSGDITFRHCIFAEPIVGARGDGKGAMVLDSGSYTPGAPVLIYGSLFVTSGTNGRNPLSRQMSLAVVNNYIYNHEYAGTYLQNNAATSQNSIVANSYRRGSASGTPNTFQIGDPDNKIKDGTQIRLEQNHGQTAADTWVGPTDSQWSLVYIPTGGLDTGVTEASITASSRTYWPDGLVEYQLSSGDDVCTLRRLVLDSAGPRPTGRDPKTIALVNDASSGDARTVANSVGTSGTPQTTAAYVDLAVNTSTFTPVGNHNYIGASGYTLLEEQIHAIEDGLLPGRVKADISVPLVGTAVTSNAGTTVGETTVPLVGTQVASSAGTVTPISGADVSVPLTGIEVPSSAGVVYPTLSVATSGTEVVTSAGLVGASQSLVGQEAISSTGTPGVSVSVALSGAQVETQAGSLSPTFVCALTGHLVDVGLGDLVADLVITPTGIEVGTSAGTLTPSSVGDVTIELSGSYVTTHTGVVKPFGGDLYPWTIEGNIDGEPTYVIDTAGGKVLLYATKSGFLTIQETI